MRFALFVLSAILALDQSAPQRDRPATASATGIVRGKVTSATTGDPLHRVRVTLNGPAQPPPSGVTNTRGEFEINNVPAGTYSVTARRTGHLTMQYGQHPGELGRSIIVAAGEVTGPIDFSLVRGSTLSGVISDDIGMEYAGVKVDAVEFKYVRGRRIPVTAATTTTNDLGQFRLSGLSPGPYLLRASTMDTWTSDDGAIAYAFAPTFYPGVTAIGESETVALNASQEMANLNFGLRVGRAARITGTYQAPPGQPIVGQTLSLSLIMRTVGNAIFASGSGGPPARTDQNGAFEFRNLAPGEYTVSTGNEADRGSVTVVLAEGDERAIVIGPRARTPVPGTVRVDPEQPAPFAPTRLRVHPVAADPDYLPPNTFLTGAVSVTRDWTFRYDDLTGPYLFRLEGLPDDWLLARVTANGNDVTDIPVEIGPGRDPIRSLQITITNHAATLKGTVANIDGRPAPDATVIVFAADRSRWSVASRFIKAARPQADGTFTIAGLAPGPYLAIARASLAEGQWEDPSFLSTLVEAASSFEARAGESSSVALRVERAR